MLLTGQLLVLVRGESQTQVYFSPLLLFPSLRLLQVPPAADPAGRDVLQSNLHAAQQLVVVLPSRGVQRFLDELPQAAAVLHQVDLGQLLVDTLLGVEVPHVQSHGVLLHTVDISENRSSL